MKAMIFESAHTPLREVDRSVPKPETGQILLRVRACGVCRTDVHIADGEIDEARYPIVPGHQIVGIVESDGGRFEKGSRVGVPWLGWTCGKCAFCIRGRENLCDNARFTGCSIDGGFAEYAVADERFCFPIPESYGDAEAAPLLCAGMIGFRALRMTEAARRIGFYGFGSSAHLLTQIATATHREVYAFTRPGDAEGQRFARTLGAVWAGGSDEPPPIPLDAAIIFASAGALVPQALRAVTKGGVVVCAGIHMSDIPSFPYSILWGERRLVSVANLTRDDGAQLFEILHRVHVRPKVKTYALDQANDAIDDIRNGTVEGSAVLIVADR
ncbi:MAG: zinc-dependent alcohol dehydrogenase family protein [Thermoanaerobaculia bacterium]